MLLLGTHAQSWYRWLVCVCMRACMHVCDATVPASFDGVIIKLLSQRTCAHEVFDHWVID